MPAREKARPASSYYNSKTAPRNGKIGSGEIFNAQIADKKRIEIQKATLAGYRMSACDNYRNKGSMPSSSSHNAITTIQHRDNKGTQASTTYSRPQSGKTSLMARRNILAAPSGASARVYIDVNHPSRVMLHTDLTPLRTGDSQGGDTVMRALEASCVEKRQLGSGHMLRKQLRGVAAIAPNVTNEFFNSNTPKLPVHNFKPSKSRKESPEK